MCITDSASISTQTIPISRAQARAEQCRPTGIDCVPWATDIYAEASRLGLPMYTSVWIYYQLHHFPFVSNLLCTTSSELYTFNEVYLCTLMEKFLVGISGGTGRHFAGTPVEDFLRIKVRRWAEPSFLCYFIDFRDTSTGCLLYPDWGWRLNLQPRYMPLTRN